jgi:hypothetical protein
MTFKPGSSHKIFFVSLLRLNIYIYIYMQLD